MFRHRPQTSGAQLTSSATRERLGSFGEVTAPSPDPREPHTRLTSSPSTASLSISFKPWLPAPAPKLSQPPASSAHLLRRPVSRPVLVASDTQVQSAALEPEAQASRRGPTPTKRSSREGLSPRPQTFLAGCAASGRCPETLIRTDGPPGSPRRTLHPNVGATVPRQRGPVKIRETSRMGRRVLIMRTVLDETHWSSRRPGQLS